MSKSEIEKIKAVLSDINEQIGHLQSETYNPTDDDFESFYNLTKALEIAVEALEEIKQYTSHYTDHNHNDVIEKVEKQISEILERK